MESRVYYRFTTLKCFTISFVQSSSFPRISYSMVIIYSVVTQRGYTLDARRTRLETNPSLFLALPGIFEARERLVFRRLLFYFWRKNTGVYRVKNKFFMIRSVRSVIVFLDKERLFPLKLV